MPKKVLKTCVTDIDNLKTKLQDLQKVIKHSLSIYKKKFMYLALDVLLFLSTLQFKRFIFCF